MKAGKLLAYFILGMLIFNLILPVVSGDQPKYTEVKEVETTFETGVNMTSANGFSYNYDIDSTDIISNTDVEFDSKDLKAWEFGDVKLGANVDKVQVDPEDREIIDDPSYYTQNESKTYDVTSNGFMNVPAQVTDNRIVIDDAPSYNKINLDSNSDFAENTSESNNVTIEDNRLKATGNNSYWISKNYSISEGNMVLDREVANSLTNGNSSQAYIREDESDSWEQLDVSYGERFKNIQLKVELDYGTSDASYTKAWNRQIDDAGDSITALYTDEDKSDPWICVGAYGDNDIALYNQTTDTNLSSNSVPENIEHVAYKRNPSGNSYYSAHTASSNYIFYASNGSQFKTSDVEYPSGVEYMDTKSYIVQPWYFNNGIVENFNLPNGPGHTWHDGSSNMEYTRYHTIDDDDDYGWQFRNDGGDNMIACGVDISDPTNPVVDYKIENIPDDGFMADARYGQVAYDDNHVFLGNSTGYVVCWNHTSQSVQWINQVQTAGTKVWGLRAKDGFLYTASQGRVYDWRNETQIYHLGSITTSYAYSVGIDKDRNIYYGFSDGSIDRLEYNPATVSAGNMTEVEVTFSDIATIVTYGGTEDKIHLSTTEDFNDNTSESNNITITDGKIKATGYDAYWISESFNRTVDGETVKREIASNSAFSGNDSQVYIRENESDSWNSLDSVTGEEFENIQIKATMEYTTSDDSYTLAWNRQIAEAGITIYDVYPEMGGTNVVIGGEGDGYNDILLYDRDTDKVIYEIDTNGIMRKVGYTADMSDDYWGGIRAGGGEDESAVYSEEHGGGLTSYSHDGIASGFEFLDGYETEGLACYPRDDYIATVNYTEGAYYSWEDSPSDARQPIYMTVNDNGDYGWKVMDDGTIQGVSLSDPESPAKEYDVTMNDNGFLNDYHQGVCAYEDNHIFLGNESGYVLCWNHTSQSVQWINQLETTGSKIWGLEANGNKLYEAGNGIVYNWRTESMITDLTQDISLFAYGIGERYQNLYFGLSDGSVTKYDYNSGSVSKGDVTEINIEFSSTSDILQNETKYVKDEGTEINFNKTNASSIKIRNVWGDTQLRFRSNVFYDIFRNAEVPTITSEVKSYNTSGGVTNTWELPMEYNKSNEISISDLNVTELNSFNYSIHLYGVNATNTYVDLSEGTLYITFSILLYYSTPAGNWFGFVKDKGFWGIFIPILAGIVAGAVTKNANVASFSFLGFLGIMTFIDWAHPFTLYISVLAFVLFYGYLVVNQWSYEG